MKGASDLRSIGAALELGDVDDVLRRILAQDDVLVAQAVQVEVDDERTLLEFLEIGDREIGGENALADPALASDYRDDMASHRYFTFTRKFFLRSSVPSEAFSMICGVTKITNWDFFLR